MEQVKHVSESMPAGTDIERRNRALIAFTLLTGARDSAIASMKLQACGPDRGCVEQDARYVNTKNSKTFTTWFFPVGDEVRGIVEDWVRYLREEKLWGNDDPLFPSTQIARGCEPAVWGRWADPRALEQRLADPCRYSRRPLRVRACPISIRTASGTLLFESARNCANRRGVQGVEPEPRP